MKHVSTTEKIFNTKLIALRRARAGKREQSWLINRCIDDVVERIIDVNRSFESILIIGADSLEGQLKKALPKNKYNKIKCINSITELNERGNFNIVISLLRLQTEDNVKNNERSPMCTQKSTVIIIPEFFGMKKSHLPVKMLKEEGFVYNIATKTKNVKVKMKVKLK